MVRSRQGRAVRREPDPAAARRPVSRRRRPGARAESSRPGRPRWPAVGPGLGLIVVVAAAAALRFWALAGAPVNPFYDAAVRSMGLSWHNFFFGALDPGGRLAVDKPPIDLWLQVASTKLIGFNTSALLLPEALGGSVTAGLLYVTIRPVFGLRAAILSGLALAVLPISVVTSRSDTMDSVMMALLVAALWASVRALRTRRLRWVFVGAGLVGVAFNVKLSEALIPLPALALMWWGVAGGWRRVAAAAGAAVALVAVGMVWIAVASLTPTGHRPYPIGSRDGSIYQAVFVYNGVERLSGTSVQVAPVGSASPAGPARLLASAHPFYGPRIGVEIVAALALVVAGGLAGLAGVRGRRRAARPGAAHRPGPAVTARAVGTPTAAPTAVDGPAPQPPARGRTRKADARMTLAEPSDPGQAAPPVAVSDVIAGAPRATTPDGDARARRWVVAGVLAWLVIAGALFSAVRDLQPRYLEAVTPAVAAAIGIGCGALLRRALEPAVGVLLAAAVAATVAFAATVGGVPDSAVIAAELAGGLALVLLVAGVLCPAGRLRALLSAALVPACATAVLAAPAGVSIDLIASNTTAAAVMGSGAEFGRYLHAHRHGAYYETASANVYAVTTLIVHDAQPVLILSDFHGPVVTLAKLEQLVGLRAVRQIIISHACRSGPHCPLTTRWSLEHAREVVRGGLYEYILPLTSSPSPCSAAVRPGVDRSCKQLAAAHRPARVRTPTARRRVSPARPRAR